MRIEKPIPEEIQEQVTKILKQRYKERRQELYSEIAFVVCTFACLAMIVIAALLHG